MPVAEVDIGPPLIRSLLAEQMADLAGEPLALVANGWDNVVYRLGDQWVVRLPRRAASAGLVEGEQRWLPGLAAVLPLPIPAPVREGRPGAGYPWRWSVCPWLPGAMAAVEPPGDIDRAAEVLGQFVAALHRPAPADAPSNPYRGGPLAGRDQVTRDRIAQMHDLIDTASVTSAWDQALAVPASVDPPLWVHGDLHPANLLVSRGELSAVIDFGDLTAGDRATDLAVAWMLFPEHARPLFRDAAGCERPVDDDTWRRAWGWAVALALAYLAGSADNQIIASIGRHTLAAALADRH